MIRPQFAIRRLRPTLTIAAVLAFGAATVSLACAQTSQPVSQEPSLAATADAPAATSPAPKPAPSSAPQEQPVNSEAAPPPPGKKRAAQRRLEHLEIAPTLQYTISSGSDVIPQNGPAPNALPFDLLRLTGEARWRFNNHLGLQYQRISHTGGAGRQFRSGKPSYGGSGYDYEERELATWQFNPLLTYRAGYHYRARVCCPGAGDLRTLTAPRFLGGFFTDLAWRFGPNTIGGKPITTSFRWEQNYHRFSALAQRALVRGDYDSGQKPTFAYTLYSNFYIFHQTKLVPYYGIEYFSTYFSDNPHMSVTYRKVPGIAYRATNDLTWRFYVKNDQPGGAAPPDTSHKSTSFLEATYRFHR